MELSERQLKILQAIIADFVNTAEPVGSRSLSKNHDLGVSPATIRNEMSDLEEMGYLLTLILHRDVCRQRRHIDCM